MLQRLLLFLLLIGSAFSQQQIFNDIPTSDKYFAATNHLFFRGALDIPADGNFNAYNPADINFLADVSTRAFNSAQSGIPYVGTVANLHQIGALPICSGGINATQWIDEQSMGAGSMTRQAAVTVLMLLYGWSKGQIGQNGMWQLIDGTCVEVIQFPPVGCSDFPYFGYTTDAVAYSPFTDLMQNGCYVAARMISRLAQLIGQQSMNCDWNNNFCPMGIVTRGDVAAWVDGLFLSGTLPAMQNPVTLNRIQASMTDISDYQDTGDYQPGAHVKTPAATVKVAIHGGTYEFPRADLLDIGGFHYSHEPQGELWKYSYRFSPEGAAVVRLGDSQSDMHAGLELPVSTEPQGWVFSRQAWLHKAGTEPVKGLQEFSVTSKYRPGLLPIYIQAPVDQGRDKDTTAPTGRETNSVATQWHNQTRIAIAKHWSNNSLTQFAIGPAFAPDATAEDIKATIQTWATNYGFSFLERLAADPTRDVLESLSPTTDLEREIVNCLREVL